MKVIFKPILFFGLLIISSEGFSWTATIRNDHSCMASSESLVFPAIDSMNSYLWEKGVTIDHVRGIGISIVDRPVNTDDPCDSTMVISSLYQIEPETVFPHFFVRMGFRRKDEPFDQKTVQNLGEVGAVSYCKSAKRITPWSLEYPHSVRAEFSCEHGSD